MKSNFLLALTVAAALTAQPASKSGIDSDGMDKTCKPCEDFFRYANGTWNDKNPIPARYSRWGIFNVLNEGNEERMKVILESAAAAKAAKGSNEQKIGDLYTACTDTETLEKKGWTPLKPVLDKIAAAKTRDELIRLMISFDRDANTLPVGMFAASDLKNAESVILNIASGGLSLPERDFYFRTDDRTKLIREELRKHMSRMLALIGDKPEDTAAQIESIVALETELARATMPIVDRRDPNKRYNRVEFAGLKAMAPTIDWTALLKLWNLAPATPMNLLDPKALQELDKQLKEAPLDTLKVFVRWHALSSAAPNLSKAFRDENFAFRGTTLNGTKEQRPRWQICTEGVDNSLGEALGPVFVEKHFPPVAKKRMNDMIENLRTALRESIDNLDWMAPETKKNARLKLESFVAKIGHPDKWKDYSKVQIDRGDYFNSLKSAGVAAQERNLAKIGKPLDRTEWGMTPPTVNAYYNPTKNEIVFPAGILQPPFFDMEADDAANYGAIGAVIGHEMGHGFDDQGSKFDAQGNLKNWWTEEDRKRFEDKAGCIVDQFFNLDVGEGLRHNGKLVTGEAIGDLGGLKIAHRAYRKSLAGKPAPVIDGFTGDQRFFIAFARVWAGSQRPEALRMQLQTDPHPLGRFRVVGTVQNMPEFKMAFACKEGDAMVRPADKQCTLW